MQIQLKSVADGIAVNPCGQAARARQFFGVQTALVPEISQLLGSSNRVSAAAPTDSDSQPENRGLIPRFEAPITDEVMPEECQSIPMTQPNA